MAAEHGLQFLLRVKYKMIAHCAGKKESEISSFVANDGYGIADLQRAGCTISVSDIVRAAVKSMK